MSIAVQSNIADGFANVATLPCAFNSPNTGGNTIIAIGLFDTNAGGITSLSIEDSQNNQYTVLHGPDSNSNRASIIWRATKVAAGANTVTISPVGQSPAEMVLVILEYPAGVCDGDADQFASTLVDSGSFCSTGLTGTLAQNDELAIAYGGCFTSGNTYTAGTGWAIEQQVNDSAQFGSAVVLDSQPSGTSPIEGTATGTGSPTLFFAVLTIKRSNGTGPLAGISVGTTISDDQVAAIFPANVDAGHSCDGVVYSGTLFSWNGLTGIIQAESGQGDTAFPKIAPGEGANCRAYVADFTYEPNQGDRVAFIIVRSSAGDRNAKAVLLLS